MAKRKTKPEIIPATPLFRWFDEDPRRRAKFTFEGRYSAATITNWKLRKEIPRGELHSVASLMGITVEQYRAAAELPVSPGSPAGPKAEQLTKEALDIARAWQRLQPARQQAFHDLIFLEAVVSRHYPWLIMGRPPGESYNDYEHAMQRDIVGIAGRILLKEKSGK
jgi:hypothetical protein